MDPVASIALWAMLFVGTHILLTADPARPTLSKLLGERVFQAAYSLVSFGTLIPLCVVFGRNKHAGPVLWDLAPVPGIWWLSHILMILAFASLAGGLTEPGPASLFHGSTEVRGVRKLTRVPVFMGFALFGIAHILMNGSLGDVIFFGSFPVVGLIGGWHQDIRKAKEIGVPFQRFLRETSLLPLVAIFQGRQKWEASDTPKLALAIALALYSVLVLLGVHTALFGGNPLG